MMRWQLPVSSPVSLRGVVSATVAATGSAPSVEDELRQALRLRYSARRVLFTDSGTSALVLALRLLLPRGGTVALPAYGCFDLTAAAVFAGVRVRLYDLDPSTLSVNLASLEATLRRGVDVVLLTHLYGFPTDVPGACALSERYGARVLEDAAQGAGGSLSGRALGSFGPLSVLSFGRGKGTCAGNGGALLGLDAEFDASLDALAGGLGDAPPGWRDVGVAGAQWMLGRPWVYGIPASIPALRLGEMVYRPAHEPGLLSRAARALLDSALSHDDHERRTRRMNASRLAVCAANTRGTRLVRPIDGGEPGFLRLPVLDRHRARQPAPRLGILRGYPLVLTQHAELQGSLHTGETAPPGACELRDSLFTLPTHSKVSARDIGRIGAWLDAGQSRQAVAIESRGVA